MKKTTRELEGIFLNSNKERIDSDISQVSEEMFNVSFRDYFRDLLLTKKITQQMLFLRADIAENYGYKLISGEKHTNQRDVIIRLCYAGEFTFEETQRALKLYGMSPLYARIKRDALLITAFNNQKGNILDLNQYLKENGENPLKNCGNIE